MHKNPNQKTSWQNVGGWYDDIVGEQGHYYHQSIILPKVLERLDFPKDKKSSLIDLACGQGILSRHIPSTIEYVGIDAAATLIKAAKQYDKNPLHHFKVASITTNIALEKESFTHATIILALQNIEDPLKVFQNAARLLQTGGKLMIVLNHPCFRIPRQSSWKVDMDQKIQYRRIDRYMSPMKIPIKMHPGKGNESPETWTFHHPLSAYTQWLQKCGFTIDLIDEWCSDKESIGKAAKMENRSRQEFPLFMGILAHKG